MFDHLEVKVQQKVGLRQQILLTILMLSSLSIGTTFAAAVFSWPSYGSLIKPDKAQIVLDQAFIPDRQIVSGQKNIELVRYNIFIPAKTSLQILTVELDGLFQSAELGSVWLKLDSAQVGSNQQLNTNGQFEFKLNTPITSGWHTLYLFTGGSRLSANSFIITKLTKLDQLMSGLKTESSFVLTSGKLNIISQGSLFFLAESSAQPKQIGKTDGQITLDIPFSLSSTAEPIDLTSLNFALSGAEAAINSFSLLADNKVILQQAINADGSYLIPAGKIVISPDYKSNLIIRLSGQAKNSGLVSVKINKISGIGYQSGKDIMLEPKQQISRKISLNWLGWKTTAKAKDINYRLTADIVDKQPILIKTMTLAVKTATETGVQSNQQINQIDWQVWLNNQEIKFQPIYQQDNISFKFDQPINVQSGDALIFSPQLKDSSLVIRLLPLSVVWQSTDSSWYAGSADTPAVGASLISPD